MKKEKNINRLLWISGIPAAYTRKLHDEMDRLLDGNIKYLFFEKAIKYAKQRNYEDGELSKNSILVNIWNVRIIIKLLFNFALDKNAGVFISGIYPLPLLLMNFVVSFLPCKKIFWSDINAINALSWNIVKKNIYKIILRNVDVIMVIGSTNAIFYQWLLGQKKYSNCKILYFPYQNNSKMSLTTNPSKDYNKEKVRFLYVGRLDTAKNVGTIINAAGLIYLNGQKDFELTIVGTGKEEGALKTRVKALEITECVNFTGSIKSSEVYTYFELNDVFILASTFEPWGVVIDEALNSGLALIGTVWAGASMDRILDGYNGYRLLSMSPDYIAEIMKKYIENRQLLEEHKHNSLTYSEKQNNLEISLTSILQLFK
jgi:glycosyltransferase involved in cell wall biosynthesis